MIFAGLLFAVLLSAAADALSRWSGLGRGPSLAVVVVALTAAIAGAASALWPSISDQADQLARDLVGVLTTIGPSLLGVPLALTFGLLAALITFVPNFGPILSVVPPAILALADEPHRAAYVIVLYLAIQTVESYAITPLIQRRTVSMPPALTITAQVLLGVLVGAIGVAVATPLTAAAMTAIRLVYVEDFLEGREPDAAER